MTKRSRRNKRATASPKRRAAPLHVRLIISAALVLMATGVSVAMETFTSDRIVIVATALVFLFLMHIAFYNRLTEAYLRWADQRAARRAAGPAPPAPTLKSGQRSGREQLK